MNVHEVKSIETKSILSRLKSKDNYWGIAYNMNLYRGCQHGCIYCDTRSCCYGIGDISHISVKKNALELLDHELGTKRGKATIGTGSMNDPYMPLEKQMKLTLLDEANRIALVHGHGQLDQVDAAGDNRVNNLLALLIVLCADNRNQAVFLQSC